MSKDNDLINNPGGLLDEVPVDYDFNKIEQMIRATKPKKKYNKRKNKMKKQSRKKNRRKK